VSFEDFILNEHCQNLLVNILNAHSDNIQGEFKKEELKRSIPQEFGRR
jgi:hypothetical protein